MTSVASDAEEPAPEDFWEPVSGFSSLFWGGLVVLIDININEIDIMVDPIGFVIAAVGMHRLAPQLRRSHLILTLFYALLILSMFALFRPAAEITVFQEGNFNFTISRLWFIDVLDLAVTTAFVWVFFGALAQLAQRAESEPLRDKAYRCRTYFLWGLLSLPLLGVLTLLLRSNVWPILLVLAGYALFVVIYFLYTIHQFDTGIKSAPLPADEGETPSSSAF